MLQTTSQIYGSHYKESPRMDSENDRKVYSEPRNFRSLSPTKPESMAVTNCLEDAAKNNGLVYRGELNYSPFINGQKNSQFINRSMLASDTLAVPVYGGTEKKMVKRDITRYQPYLSPSKNPDKGMASKIGHGEYPDCSPTRLSPDGKLPWHRGEIHKEAIKKLEFGNEVTPKKEIAQVPQQGYDIGGQITPKKLQSEKFNHQVIDDPKPLVVAEKIASPRDEKISLEKHEKALSQHQEDETVPYYLKRAISAPQRDDVSSYKRISENLRDPVAIPSRANAPLQQRVDASIKPNLHENQNFQDPQRRSRELASPERAYIQASALSPESLRFRTSSSDIGRYLSKTPSQQLFVIKETDRPLTSLGLRTIPNQIGEINDPNEEKCNSVIQENTAEKSQPKTPASVRSHHTQHSHGTNESGKSLLCQICVNKRMTFNKEIEKAQLREDEIRKEQNEFKRLQALGDLERERIEKVQEEARAGTNAMKEALDQKFRDYWDQKRNAGQLASGEKKLKEQQLERQRQAALEVYQKQKDELRADLLKQMQEKQEEKSHQKQLDMALDQNKSLSNPIARYLNGHSYGPHELKNDLLKQMEDKQEQKRREFEQEKEIAGEELRRNDLMNRGQRQLAEKYLIEQKEGLRRGIEEGIAERQAKKEQELSEKRADRERILQHEELMNQSASRFHQLHQNFQKGYAQELQNQMEENLMKREDERRRDQAPYSTSLTGSYSKGYFEHLLRQHQEERAKLREEYQNQIAEKKRQREQEKIDDQNFAKSLETTKLQYNPLRDIQKALHDELSNQIRQKQQEKAEARERDQNEVQEQKDKLQRTEDEMRRRAFENYQFQKDELRKGLEKGMQWKQEEKDAINQEKAADRANIEEQNKHARSMLFQQLLNKNAFVKEYSEALAAQVSNSSAAKAHERELDRMPYSTSLTSPSKFLQKLYPCMDCSKALPKHLLTKKNVIDPPQRTGWQKY